MFNSYTESLAVFFGINILMAFSVYLPSSAGLISLGQGGFMAIGAYTAALLTASGVPFAVALAAGGCLAALSGVLVAGAAGRIPGPLLLPPGPGLSGRPPGQFRPPALLWGGPR